MKIRKLQLKFKNCLLADMGIAQSCKKIMIYFLTDKSELRGKGFPGVPGIEYLIADFDHVP